MASNTVVMSCTATGGTLSHQWRRNAVALSGKTSANLTLSTNITSADAGSYDCAVSNSCGTVYTRKATLTVSTACRVGRIGGVANGGSFGDVAIELGDFNGDGYRDFAVGNLEH